MSEWSKEDLTKWLQLSVDKNCSIYDSIRYTFFFEGQDKIMRAYRYALHSLALNKED